MFVNVTLFLLLCERDVTLGHALYVMYTLGELYSLLSVKLFTCDRLCLITQDKIGHVLNVLRTN
jgi:hypothetical protein